LDTEGARKVRAKPILACKITMHPYWETITQPLLSVVGPKVVVEIGSEAGKSTRRLLEFCKKNGATLHAIDPMPAFDVEAWQREFGSFFVFHRAMSLDALRRIERIDAACIDGDHNWYTVFNELKLIEQRSLDLGHPFPVVMLHDIGWPYGRRDLYYNPSAIPAEHRQLYQKRGLRPGSEQLAAQGGLNAHLYNAIDENTPRNGVLTAIEDFMNQSGQALELVRVPGFHGLGILVARERREQNESLAKLLAAIDLAPTMRQYVERLESARLRLAFSAQEQRASVARLEAKVRVLEAELGRLRSRQPGAS
jgi:hypothetical protein